MAPVEAVISDFGGVLTSPLIGSFTAFQETSGVPLQTLGQAIAAVGEARGSNPLFDLETGRLGETEFLEVLGAQLSSQLGRVIDLEGFGASYFAHLEPNHEVIEFMRRLRGRGYRMAICTNNVREWEPLWRAMVPVEEIFELVVDSAFVGVRKPEPAIYELTLERLGVAAPVALLLDDIEINCEAARALGMQAVHFRTSAQAIDETESALRNAARPGAS